MKRFLVISILFVLNFSAISQKNEYYFRFIEPNKDIINSSITRIISIDNVKRDTVYAYANRDELTKFEKLGYKYTILPSPSLLNTKVITMATTVAQMANWNRYPTYRVYRTMMKKFEHDYPTLCKLDSIGTTNNGHEIYVVKLSNNVTIEEPEVEVFYTSSMHGDEATGYVLMLRLIDYLLSNYSTDSKVTSMLNNMAIYINPAANPDGTYNGVDTTVAYATRYNSKGYDLNRDFPDKRFGINSDSLSWQIETKLMIKYASSRHFTLSANFHGGSEVVNYPYDDWTSSLKIHPDNNWFIHLSKQYADSVHKYGPAGYFTDVSSTGYTNGGDWYVVAGGRQDYMNWWQHCKEVTIEISYTKLISSSLLPNFWNYNKEALLNYLVSASKGFKGIVKNTSGNPVKAKVIVSGHDADSSHVYSSQSTGFYARPIEPGTWQVTYSAAGYLSQTKTISIPDWEASINQDIVLEVDQSGVLPIEPTDQTLLNVWPNPFSNQVNCKFTLVKPYIINLSIYSIDGGKVATIADELYQIGSNTITWNAPMGVLNSGSYVIVLKVGEKTFSQIVQHIH